jgi:phospholipid/cholesterol/gamma-HCH transport system permease protein
MTKNASKAAAFETDHVRIWLEGEVLRFGLKNAWNLYALEQLEDQVNELQLRNFPVEEVEFHCGGLTEFDLSGAWLLYRTAERLRATGKTVKYSGFKQEHFSFIEQVMEIEAQGHEHPEPRSHLQLIEDWFTQALADFSGGLQQRIEFGSSLLQGTLTVLRTPGKMRWIATMRHIQEAGVNALPVVLMMSFLVAVVLAFQGKNQLAQFGAQIYTVDLVSISVLREMGILLTAILVAGRSGSAFAAEIGVMQLNEEVNAMETMGVRPVEVLVIPRVIALVVTLPLLGFLANIAGLLGTLVVVNSMLDIPVSLAIERFLSLDVPTHFKVGLIKAPFFAMVIAMTACYRGMYVKKSADAVGRNTTSAVVESIFLVIVVDAIFSIIFTELGW